MRLTAERFNIRVTDLTPRSLINRLFSEGLMERKDYDFLITLMGQRNAVAHGFRQPITLEDLRRLREVAHELLTE